MAVMTKSASIEVLKSGIKHLVLVLLNKFFTFISVLLSCENQDICIIVHNRSLHSL